MPFNIFYLNKAFMFKKIMLFLHVFFSTEKFETSIWLFSFSKKYLDLEKPYTLIRYNMPIYSIFEYSFSRTVRTTSQSLSEAIKIY